MPLDSPNAAAQASPQMPSLVKAVVPSPRSDVPAEVTPRQASKPLAIVPVAAALPSPGSSVVQVAAMSHQEDADVVAVDLKRRGYTVAIRHEPQDKLFHVQIGPFTNKKEADAMRQQGPVLIGLIATLTDSSLQEDMVASSRRVVSR